MEPFKNNISPALVSSIAVQLEKQIKGFSKADFIDVVVPQLEPLALKERIQLIAEHIYRVLPSDNEAMLNMLLNMLHPNDTLGYEVPSDELGVRGWGVLTLSRVVGQHGLASFDASLNALKLMTPYFSSELDVRFFILADQQRALDIIATWVDSPNYHVRRLVSEGTRPRLPWAVGLPSLVQDPSPVLPFLTALRDDNEEYVRRSVANHLNDIAKDHPDLVADIAQTWMIDADSYRKKLLRHACRTLIKQGHPKALAAFGFASPKLQLKHLKVNTKEVVFGQSVDFSVKINSLSDKEQSLIIDYIIHFKKANGQLAPKVFKWKIIKLLPSESVSINRSHAIKPITTRKYYAGNHALSLRINGKDFGLADFSLLID